MPSLIYLHGFASGPASRKAQFFCDRFRSLGIEVKVPDLVDGEFADLTLSAQLAVIEREARGQPVRLMGSSMGGYLAALYAARHPEVERVVLMAPAFGFARLWRDELGPEGVERWRQSGTLPVFHYAKNKEAGVGYQLLADADRYEEFPEFSQPALVFHGSKDPVVPLSASEQFVVRQPNARLRTMDSGHDLTDVMEEIWEDASWFLTAA